MKRRSANGVAGTARRERSIRVADEGRAWWWYAPPGICVALLGMSLVLLNFGLDELGNPRLRLTAAK